ncbi:hypothetical protein KSP39_PZI013865 [Platanthera zijinensis]|uniref:Amine oxidase n=1 Tax=Platanthera zijinensis TaxID=2320716 RepID=A0AAP0BCH7_9ASPA
MMVPVTRCFLLLCFLLLCFILISPSSSHPHPLDPLTPAELSAVRSIITSSPLNLSASLTFHYVGLDEPDKSSVLSWSSAYSSSLPPRRAIAILRAESQTHELVVDIAGAAIVSHIVQPGTAYPMLTAEEEAAAGLLPKSYAPFVESVRKRGLQLEDVLCTSYTRGWFGAEAAKGEGWWETANLYVRPLEGIKVVVDLDEMKILEYRDREVAPVPPAEGTEYRAAKQRPPFGPRGKRVVVEQPEGKGFDIHGHVIR